MTFSKTHLVLIPSYNSGPKLADTLLAARAVWGPVWVVIDGSTDSSAGPINKLAHEDPGVRVITRARRGGKGQAVLDGLSEAERAGFTHALIMDADGQHPSDRITSFMAQSMEQPDAVILGRPVFDHSAPRIRLWGRRIANWCARFVTLGSDIGDALFGFRVYPIAPLRSLMSRSGSMRGFDFDPEAAIRLTWLGHPVLNLGAPVQYFSRREGGVSHFRYGRDNLLLSWMYLRLLIELGVRWPDLRVGLNTRRDSQLGTGLRSRREIA